METRSSEHSALAEYLHSPASFSCTNHRSSFSVVLGSTALGLTVFCWIGLDLIVSRLILAWSLHLRSLPVIPLERAEL